MVIYYQVGSYTILLYLALGFIPQTPLLVTAYLQIGYQFALAHVESSEYRVVRVLIIIVFLLYFVEASSANDSQSTSENAE